MRLLKPTLLHAFLVIGAYLAWTTVIRLAILTAFTYFSLGDHGTLREISDQFIGFDLPIFALSSASFIWLLFNLKPSSRVHIAELFSAHRIRNLFFPGFFHGIILMIGVLIALVASGYYRFIGLYLETDELFPLLFSMLLRFIVIVLWICSEEILYRNWLQPKLEKEWGTWMSWILIAIIAIPVKAFQFDLGLMDYLTLTLIYLLIGIRTSQDGSFHRGSGFWIGLVFVSHLVSSLPLYGQEFSGILTLKFQEQGEEFNRVHRWLTGGVGGPFSSFGLQLTLLIELTWIFASTQNKNRRYATSNNRT